MVDGEEEEGEWEVAMKPIAGRTVAERVMFLLNKVTTSSRPGELNLLFTSSAPFIGFSAISGLAALDRRFEGVVDAGSMMVFEVFSHTEAGKGRPGREDLWVRFLYRNGTGEGEGLLRYPLFGRGRGRMDMRFAEFEEAMGGVGVGVGVWCEGCAAGGVFCPAFVEAVERGRKEGEEKEKEKNGGGGRRRRRGRRRWSWDSDWGRRGWWLCLG